MFKGYSSKNDRHQPSSTTNGQYWIKLARLVIFFDCTWILFEIFKEINLFRTMLFYVSFQNWPQPIKESSWLNLYSGGQFWNVLSNIELILKCVNTYSTTNTRPLMSQAGKTCVFHVRSWACILTKFTTGHYRIKLARLEQLAVNFGYQNY